MQHIDHQDGLTERSGEAAHQYLGVFLKRQQGKKQKLKKIVPLDRETWDQGMLEALSSAMQWRLKTGLHKDFSR